MGWEPGSGMETVDPKALEGAETSGRMGPEGVFSSCGGAGCRQPGELADPADPEAGGHRQRYCEQPRTWVWARSRRPRDAPRLRPPP